MDIPIIFRDNTTIISNHTLLTYLFCVSLRILIAILIILEIIPLIWILFLSIIVIILFTRKYFLLPNVWKVYLRNIITYLIILILLLLTNINDNKFTRTIIASLIIFDALSGLQSRHTATMLNHCNCH